MCVISERDNILKTKESANSLVAYELANLTK